MKNPKRFAELERITSDYFACHLAPLMGKVKDDLSHKQAEEMRDYSTSAAGILGTMATTSIPGADPYAALRVTGEWNSKTAEDYIIMCKQALVRDKSMQHDLAMMAGEWRNAVVKEIGRPRYDALCQQLGCDLAYAYIDHRMEQLMIDKIVKDKMPKSSADYIIRKAAQSSLFGLTCELSQSPLEAEIAQRGEAAYKPSTAEKAAGHLIGAGVDAVSLGGAGSWASFAKFVGIDVVLSAGMDMLGRRGTRQTLSVEDCISKGVFASDKNVFASFRKEANSIKNSEDSYIISTNNKLQKKIPTTNYNFKDWMKQNSFNSPTAPWNTTPSFLSATNSEAKKREGKYKDVPLIVAPGKEDAYLEEKKKQKKSSHNTVPEKEKPNSNENVSKLTGDLPQSDGNAPHQTEDASSQDLDGQSAESNQDGWAYLLSSVGLNGLSDIGRNLPYVIATLPDMLVGLFTGATESVGLKKDLIPISSVLLGLFVKNPMLKMLLIGMGGMNLLNKVGHESIGRMEDGMSKTLYKSYADETLNPRIVSPVLKGNVLIATIDGVPCSITIPDNAAQAYATGALPLNTLANAILSRYDQTKNLAEDNFRNIEVERTVTRDRGITIK